MNSFPKNTECFIGCDSDYETAAAVIFGAPYDGTTTNRPGARFASKAIRAESFGLETYSPYQDKDLTDIKVFDAGELELPFGDPAPVLDIICGFTQEILNDGKLPVMLGGEHLVTLGAFDAVFQKYPGVYVVHLDAHADLRDDYLGQRLSHASVMRRCWELVGDGRIYQFGIRSCDREEILWGKRHVFTEMFTIKNLPEYIDKLQGKPIYLTLDLDVLDSSVFPATGTPEAGGISFNELLEGIIQLKDLNIVGCDINELSPPYDATGASAAVACKVLRELLLAVVK